jgi:hypothetical protein
MDPDERRDLGAHYTSEQNILKVISGLFLDELNEEYETAKKNPAKLRKLQDRIAGMRFLDPACGSGNFLIVAYKELRRLEMRILARLEELDSLHGSGQQVIDVSSLSRLSVHFMYGIEIEEFPARIAEVALWLIDHLMNVELAKQFGGYFVRLPLIGGPTILNTDALELDWKGVVMESAPDCEWFIMGNPPFAGSKFMTPKQRDQIVEIADHAPGAGVLDYVTGWFLKAAAEIQNTNISCAFVAPNSLSNGEQVGILWSVLAEQRGIEILFAHQAFRWTNEARGAAVVYCIVIGFALRRTKEPVLYEYATMNSKPQRRIVSEINGYLMEGSQVYILSRARSISGAPEILFGNMPLDGGHLLLSRSERDELLMREPQAGQYVKRCVGAKELLNGEERYCLWLDGVSPNVIRTMPNVMKRVESVREFRLSSRAASTRKYADTPWTFRDTRHPSKPYLVVPMATSTNRFYIPLAFVTAEVVTTNLNYMVPEAELYHFGVLSSLMHMAWVRYVCGRYGPSYRYSRAIVYNNYPWPTQSESQQKTVEECAQAVLTVREMHPDSCLADLYDPAVMPKDLRRAHENLDKAVDACYGRKTFNSERERVEMLFEMYTELVKGEAA